MSILVSRLTARAEPNCERTSSGAEMRNEKENP